PVADGVRHRDGGGAGAEAGRARDGNLTPSLRGNQRYHNTLAFQSLILLIKSRQSPAQRGLTRARAPDYKPPRLRPAVAADFTLPGPLWASSIGAAKQKKT